MTLATELIYYLTYRSEIGGELADENHHTTQKKTTKPSDSIEIKSFAHGFDETNHNVPKPDVILWTKFWKIVKTKSSVNCVTGHCKPKQLCHPPSITFHCYNEH